MKASVAELVSVILEQIEMWGEEPVSEKMVRSFLKTQGYNHRDIDAALKFLGRRFAEEELAAPSFSPPLRHLAFYESAKISPEVHSALIRLEMRGLIESHERELLLERFLRTEGEADMEALDFALSYILGATRNMEVQQTIQNVFDGYGPTMH